ncbi:cyclin-dependent kinase inhibitor 1D [Pseudoliparis swirei]|uniref:cyclin-dependent kinase inhibitor 1D n=1 Tax=Pseudoliparis swirei TaxID=2059687 RepID=UPI0024BF0150|nr:cyclin-dependent kinase inhibitor 1D [Pseudoliparis swirei]
MAMASLSTPTAGPATPPQPELSRLRGAEVQKLKPVRRSLFGPVDHQQLKRDFQRLLCRNLDVAKKRWNFDFQHEKPGEGSDIKWEELGDQEVPAFYRSCTVGPSRPVSKIRSSSAGEGSPGDGSPGDGSPGDGSPGDGSPGYSSSFGSGDEYLEVTTRGCYRVQRHGKHKQSAITDFFKVKKRKLLHDKASSWQ